MQLATYDLRAAVIFKTGSGPNMAAMIELKDLIFLVVLVISELRDRQRERET